MAEPRRRRRESPTQRRERIHQAALRRRAEARRADLPIRRQINAAVQERFGDTLAINRELERRVPAFYDAYRQDLQRYAEQARQGFAAQHAAIQQQTQQGFQQANAQNDAMFAQMERAARLRGETVDPALRQTAAQAAQARQQAGEQYANLTGGIAANSNALFANRGVVASAQRLQAQEGVASRRRNTAREIGLFRRQERARIAENQQKAALEAQLFGLKQDELGLRAEDTRADNRRADAQARREAAQQRRENRRAGVPNGFSSLEEFQRYRDEHLAHGHNVDGSGGHSVPGRGRGRGSGGSGGGRTDSQVGRYRKILGQIENAVRHGRRVRIRNYSDLVGVLSEERTEDFPNGGGYDPVIAEAAAQILLRGGIASGTARSLRGMGLYTVPRRYRARPRRVSRPPTAPGPGRSGRRPT